MVTAHKEARVDLFAGTGEMGARIRAFDWDRTALGPIELWPPSLKITVNLILSSHRPMWIGWGREMKFLYNDACLHVLGPAKYLGALGRPASEVWAEIWDVCGPPADKVFENGEASVVDDVRLFVDCGSFLEETFYSFSYSPIHDESGIVSGLFCSSTEVTAKVLSARRLRALSELASETLTEETTGAACATACILGENREDIPFALFYLADAEGKRAHLEQVLGSFQRDLTNAATVDLSEASGALPWPIAEVFHRAERRIVSIGHLSGVPAGVANRPVRQAVVLPVTCRGEQKPYGVLIAGVNPCRPLDADYLTFFELLAAQVARVWGRGTDTASSLPFGMSQFSSNRIETDNADVRKAAEERAELLAKAEREIAERERVEQALRESERRFREMVDSLPAAIYTTDAEGRLTHFNPAAVKLSGRAPELGTDQWCVTWKLFLPDGTPLPHEECAMAVALKGGRVIPGAECIAERPDGTRFWFTAYPRPLRDAEGRIAGGINMLVDITERKAAEEALHHSEERFRCVFRSSAVGVAILTLGTRFLEANDSFCAITGYSEQELKALDCLALAHPEDRGVIQAQLDELTRDEQQTFIQEMRCFTKDGRTIWVQDSVSLLRDAAGRPEYIAVLCEDVTERKTAERTALLLAAIVGSSDDAIVSKNLNGIITSWNTGAERLFGYTPDEVIGKPVTIIIPADRLNEEPAILARLQRGERIDHFETIRQRKDGKLLNVSLTISPVKDAKGNVIGASKIARDITDQKRAEAALRESEAKFRHLADSMPQMVWTACPDGYTDYYNQRWYEFTGFSRETFGDQSWERILHPEDLKHWRRGWYGCVKSGESYMSEYRFWDCHKNRWLWFMSRALPVRDEAGRIVKWFGTCTDIDVQKGVEEELRRANEDLQQFAYSASHDLQEPLRTIKIYTQLLTKRYRHKLDGQGLEFCDYVSAGATRMEGLVRDLLAYTQVARLTPPDKAVDTTAALNEALANLAGSIEESGAQIISGPLPRVCVHSTHLKQLFQNLVGNALKYRSPERCPIIHIAAVKQGEMWMFSVNDNGIGIDPEYREQVFGLFKRLHTGEEYPGTGIGLAICQRIVERYQGRIWVESRPGQGSTFTFTLPC